MHVCRCCCRWFQSFSGCRCNGLLTTTSRLLVMLFVSGYITAAPQKVERMRDPRVSSAFIVSVVCSSRPGRASPARPRAVRQGLMNFQLMNCAVLMSCSRPLFRSTVQFCAIRICLQCCVTTLSGSVTCIAQKLDHTFISRPVSWS